MSRLSLPTRRLLYGAVALTSLKLTLDHFYFNDSKALRSISEGLNQNLRLALLYNQFGPFLRKYVDGETSHSLAIRILSHSYPLRRLFGLVDLSSDYPSLHTSFCNLFLTSPILLSAGFDKSSECISGCLDLGFAGIEIGSVTPLPQDGNVRPRVFRLEEDKAIINRYGFNNDGSQRVKERLEEFLTSDQKNQATVALENNYPPRSRIVGVNLGKNKTSESAIQDYVHGVRTLGSFADYLVVNVSSPNTSGLRDLQAKNELFELLHAVKHERDCFAKRKPLFVKIAPDLSLQQKRDIAETVLQVGIDGIVVSNTTIYRPSNLKSKYKNEVGGLSGAPLKKMSTQCIREFYQLTNGRIPIIGVGGIENGRDAYEKIKAGASVVQLYTAFAYEGPLLIGKIKQELKELVKKDGYKSIQQAVGKEA